jgi:signal transduction histidine kinase
MRAGICRPHSGWVNPDRLIESCRILVIEDSSSDFAILKAELDVFVAGAFVEHAPTLQRSLQQLSDAPYDAVLVDLGLPDSDGMDTFERVSESAGSAAIVVITGDRVADLGEQAVRSGAQDYLVKGSQRVGETGRAVAYAIRRQRVMNDLQRARDAQLLAKSDFLSHVSHELRSPLAVVHQFGSLLEDGAGGPLNAQQSEFIAILMRNVSQLKVMIDDLLDVSREQHREVSVEIVRTSLGDLLSETVAAFGPLAGQHQIALELVDSDLPDVSADPGRVREVLGQLLENAVKFTPPGGRISVSGAEDGAMVRLTVRDTGCGLTEHDSAQVFDQFFQASPSDERGRNGLGLGLFISRELIRRQGGVIWVESVPGRGAAFSFTLPVALAYKPAEVSA